MAVCFTPDQEKRLGLRGKTNEEMLRQLQANKLEIHQDVRQAKMQILVHHKALKYVLEYRTDYKIDAKTGKKRALKPGELGELDPKQGLKAFLARDRYEMPRLQANGEGWGGTVDSHRESVNATYHKMLKEMMAELTPRLAGLNTRQEVAAEMIHAMYGTSKNAQSVKFAKKFIEVNKLLMERYNRAGGNIKMLDRLFLPQVNDSLLIKKKGYNFWADNMKKNMNWSRMSMSDSDIDVKLRKLYDQITREGQEIEEVLEEIHGSGSTKMANLHQNRVIIHFENAEGWLDYNREFSKDTPYNAMMNHVSTMSNQIALMEKMGPNPNATMESLSIAIIKVLGDKNAADFSRAMYANLAGKTNPRNHTTARVNEAIRNITSTVKLPMSVASALPDVVSNMMAASYNGFSGFGTAMRMIKLLAGTNIKENRILAGELGMNLNFLIDEAHTANRFNDTGGHGIFSRAASFVVKAGGLNHWTVAAKMAFHFGGMQTLGGGNLRKNKELMMAFGRHGIGESMIKEIEASKKMVRQGHSFLDTDQLSQKTAEAVTAFLNSETKLAVPEGDVFVRAILNQGTQRGTAGGETLRYFAMFKTFMVSQMAGNLARIYMGTGYSKAGRLGATVNLIIGTTLLGAMSLQLLRIARGEELLDMDNTQFWQDAAMKGGAFSLFGDILHADARNFGGLAEFVGGPAVGLIDDLIWQGALGTLDKAWDVQLTLDQLARNFVGALPKYIPGQFIYTKMAMDRMFLDQMKVYGDPSYNLKKMRRETKRKIEYQREKW